MKNSKYQASFDIIRNQETDNGYDNIGGANKQINILKRKVRVIKKIKTQKVIERKIKYKRTQEILSRKFSKK